MKRLKKVLTIIFLTLFTVLLLIAVGVGVFINKTLEKETNKDLPFFQSIKMAVTLNFESESEKQLKEKRLNEKYRHISIYYPDDFKELMPITKETLDWAMDKNEQVFGNVETRPVDLVMFENKEDLNDLSSLVDVSGFYSDFDKLLAINYTDKNLILERRETPLYHFQKAILHEYTHYVFQRKIEGSDIRSSDYPLWFQEGIAEYIGNDGTTVLYSDFQLVPFGQLFSGEQWRIGRQKDGSNVYKQSYFAIKYLTDTYDESIVNEIIAKTKHIGDFETGFTEATGITLHDLENNFLNSYK
ncbi:peptidase MA family metallohydrolase [Halobacillus halophilus]|uniref:peptidase MA family metallohydrolase n=1 Tax=Halobacillus halophilus TaxID=1570 RepID=UPI00136F7675